ncbi:MAG: OST-HTH/LOTUS domain-containing protein, partial [Chitinophagaceae bacterium]
CEIFTHVENLEPKIEKEEKKEVHKKEKITVDTRLINKAFDMSANESNEVYVSTMGLNLRKLDPSFDSRTYGFKTLTQLFSKLRDFIVVDNIVNGLNNPLIKRK